jgi:glycosyltransferase involved in cell wall biosynthesis
MPGFMSDRTQILNHMKQSDVFLFCHKTPESPRCLIEALVCGTPIVGYGSGYPRDLVSQDGGGDFVPVGETDALAEKLIALDRDRPALARLIGSAAQSGLRFDEQTVYSHRAGLIRQNL